jgi:hypothetical protein
LQLGARHAPDGDVGVTRNLKYLAQARLVRALGHGQTLHGSRARAQGFEHGLDAEDVRAVILRLLTPRRITRLAFRQTRAVTRPRTHTESSCYTVARRLATAPVRALLSTARVILTSSNVILTPARALLVPPDAVLFPVVVHLPSARVRVLRARRASASGLTTAALAPPRPPPVPAVLLHKLSARAPLSVSR